MRKLWFRRKAQATMIAGIIVLAVMLTAMVAMVIVGQQNDAYQSTVNRLEQKNIDMYSENLLGAFPGLYNGTQSNGYQLSQVSPCGGAGSTCDVYTVLVNNFGIGTQIARIYINTTGPFAPGTTPCLTPCVLDPALTPTPYSFDASTGSVNAGEFFHTIVIWLPHTPNGLPSTCGSITSACNTIKLVTTRGRIFMFLWPFVPLGEGISGGKGGTGIYIGPLVITFERNLFTYTTPTLATPPLPIMSPNPGGAGTIPYWAIPSQTNLIIYVKIQTDVGVEHDVYLTAQSVFEIAQYTNPGVIRPFFIIAPIQYIPGPPADSLCETGFNAQDSSILCETSYGYSSSGNAGNPNSIARYQACPVAPNLYNSANCAAYGPRYMIPKPNDAQKAAKQRGDVVIVAFGAQTLSDDQPQSVPGAAWDGNSVTSYLGLSFVYDDGSGAYVYGVTLPFIAMCIKSCRI